MPWVRFTADFDWRKAPRVVTAYKAGMVQLVSQSCREAAVGSGKAVETTRPAGAPAMTGSSSPQSRQPASIPAVRRRKNVG